MGITERRERERENRRNDIIDAAEKVFFTKGKEKTSMDDIAREAELSKGALYLYFKSKEDLYFALNYRGLMVLEKMFVKAGDSKSTGLEKTMAMLKSFFDFQRQHPDYFNVLNYFEANNIVIDEADSFTLKCHNQAKHTLSIFVTAIFVGISDKSISPDVDPIETSISFWGQMTGIINLISLKGERLENDFNIKKENIEVNFLRMALKLLEP